MTDSIMGEGRAGEGARETGAPEPGARAGRTSPPALRLHHIGIAVEDLIAARERFASILGLEPSPIEEVPSEGVRVSFFELAGARIELLEGTGPQSPIRRFLESGRSGVHHISLAVEGAPIAQVREELSRRGVEVIGDAPRPGSEGSLVFFVHPRSASGVLIEFSGRKGT